ncbi:MAG: YtxH domain-containing protein [Anaerolineae bacterium]|nr:YtxH domain-containing protein [Anaerolineae bacterium]
MAERDSGLEFLAGFVIGGLVGAAVALILAPQSGEETRAQIREKGIELKDRAGELAVEARQKAEELSEEARKKAEELSAETRKKVEEIIADARVRLEEAIAEGKKAATKKKEELLAKAKGPAEIEAEAEA